jgi:hypothetical protein
MGAAIAGEMALCCADEVETQIASRENQAGEKTRGHRINRLPPFHQHLQPPAGKDAVQVIQIVRADLHKHRQRIGNPTWLTCQFRPKS